MSAHDNHSHATHGTVTSYLVGFVLAAVLTIVPFWAVMSGGLSPLATGLTVIITAVLQVLVHLKFFLHLDGSKEQRMNLAAGLFTVLVIAIIVVGTLWVMWDMNYFMMH